MFIGPVLLAQLMLSAGPSGNALDLEQLYLKTASSSVVVVASIDNEDGTTTESNGGGVLLEGGYVLTACHVVEFDGKPIARAELVVGDKRSEGMVRAGSTVEAKVLRCDTERDLALLKPLKPLKARQLKLAKSDPRPGAPVLAVGPASNGFPWSVHECRVSGLGRLRMHSTERLGPVTTPSNELSNVVALDVSCMGGHPLSGSAVFDRSGRVVGLKQFRRFRTHDKASTSREFYIAASEIRAFLDE
ncbi:MAG: serine protease [Nannocystaceae bacterium]|nr:serine protease [Nannocystaceae bacterium]